MSQTHSSISSSGLDPYASADVYCWWDIISCPPIKCNPYTIVGNIRKAIKDKGYYGRITIQSLGCTKAYPLSVQFEVDKVVDLKNPEAMLYALCMWALSHRPPATYLLMSDNINHYCLALEHLKSRGYNVVIARPCSLSTFSCFTWETFSIGASPIIPASSSHFVVPFGRHSIFDVQKFFKHLHNMFGGIRFRENKSCLFTSTELVKVVIVRVEGPDTAHAYTSVKYASRYKRVGWNPALICIGTSCVDDLMHNADLAGIPFRGCQTESMAYDAIESYTEEHDLIIVDTSIYIADYDINDVSGPEGILHRLCETVKPDLVLFAVKPKYIIKVYDWSEDYLKRMGIILLIDETIKNQGPEFLDRVTSTRAPIFFSQRGGKFKAVSVVEIVELVLGVCDIAKFFDEYTLNMMISYYMALKEKLCPRHSKITNEVPTTLNELLIAAYRLWVSTQSPICEDCLKTVFARVMDRTPGTKGLIEVTEPASFIAKKDNNLSLVEYKCCEQSSARDNASLSKKASKRKRKQHPTIQWMEKITKVATAK